MISHRYYVHPKTDDYNDNDDDDDDDDDENDDDNDDNYYDADDYDDIKMTIRQKGVTLIEIFRSTVLYTSFLLLRHFCVYI